MDYANRVVTTESEKNEMLELERQATERTRQTLVAVVVGSILGFAIGVGQLVVIGSWELVYWPLMPMIPLYSALGWALFGMIIGGSGVFGKAERKAEAGQSSRAA